MSRYIDADKILPYISRLFGGMPLAVLKIAETDSIDIVRCKECYMCDEEMWCSFYDSIMESDGFYSYGEREGE